MTWLPSKLTVLSCAAARSVATVVPRNKRHSAEVCKLVLLTIITLYPFPCQVASVTGDVRRALEICRLASQIAEREEADAVEAGGTPISDSVGI